MAQSPVIYALIEKRGEVSGRIAELEELTRQARADLAHIDATLLMFDPGDNASRDPGESPRQRAVWLLRQRRNQQAVR